VVLILVTLFGAYPVYAFVARCSSAGQGSIGMLAKLVSGWGGKILILTLLGFAATDFVITKTLSAADAAKHLIENPNWPLHTDDHQEHVRQQLFVTFGLLALLGGMFLRGFREVITIAVVLVVVFISLNLVVIVSGVVYLLDHTHLATAWYEKVRSGNWAIAHPPISVNTTSLFGLLAMVLVLFPKLALGLSGFETGVAVMPLIRGSSTDTPENPAGRVRNTHKLLLTAAIIMSSCLMGSSVVVTMLIPPQAFLHEDPQHPGLFITPEDWSEKYPNLPPPKAPAAYERALAYLAHNEGPHKLAPFFGSTFGTAYDLSTIVILWFAGASAMAALINLVPKYLPQYGMAPEWARAVRPLVLLLTGINLVVTYFFDADVTKQGDAYATGVLVLLTSACVATLIEKWRTRMGSFGGKLSLPYLLITLIFVYTTIAIVFEKPVGLMISLCFIAAIMATSFLSRVLRSRELRFSGFRIADAESKLLWDTIRELDTIILVPHRPGRRTLQEKEQSVRREHRIPRDIMIIFVEVNKVDASDFAPQPIIRVRQEQGRYILQVNEAASTSHTLAAIALEMAKVGSRPEILFGWTDETPWSGTLGFLLFGEGNIPWMVRELIRRAEPEPSKRPLIIIAGA
jgi:hypothetical protein